MKLFNKFIRYFFVPSLLFLLWMALTAAYIAKEDLGFISLDSRFKFEQFKSLPKYWEIRRGDVETAEFSNEHSNFGTVGIRFNNPNPQSQDKLVFRIKEVGTKDWYHQETYNANQLETGKIFHFDFKQIKDSKGKTFYFELESLSSATGSAVSISNQFPTFISRNYFDKGSIYFVVQKIINLFTYKGFTSHFVSYSLPLFIFLYFSAFGITFHIPIFLFFLLLLIDITFVKERHDALTASIIFAWLLPVIKFKVESKVPAYFALIFTMIFPILLGIGLTNFAEKFATWSYLFFTLAVIQKIYELLYKPKKILSFSQFMESSKYAAKIFYLMIIGEVKLSIQTVEQKKEIVEETADQLTLLIQMSRLGKTIASTIIIASKFSAFIIYHLIVIIRLVLLLGPYVLFIWLLRMQVINLFGYFNFYSNFFVSNQENIFWSEVGRYFALIFALSMVVYVIVILFLLLIKKINLRILTLLATLFLFITINLTRSTFNKNTIYQYDIIIWAITPKDTSEAWVDVTIYGRNFKNLPFRGQVLVNGVEHRLIKWSDKEIIFRTNPTTTKSGKIEIITFDGERSNGVDFKYEGYR